MQCNDVNMKLFLTVLALLLHFGRASGLKQFRFVGGPNKIASLQDGLVQEKWFEQKLDHWETSNQQVWKQRYFVNDIHYRQDEYSPVFLMIGGEAEVSKQWMTEGAWIHYAERFGALCFQLEHRFYGKSHPTKDLSVENMVYLTSEQALADIVNFIKAVKVSYKLEDSQKWIAFGGSYPGSLAAWAREKYPDFIYGAISSSAPLLAKVDFEEYFKVVKQSLDTYNDKCSAAVGKAFYQVDIMLQHQIGQKGLDEKFKTCTSLKESAANHFDFTNFYEKLAGNLADVVQYNKDNSPHASVTIDKICEIMVNETIGPQVTRLGIVNGIMLSKDKKDCLDYKYDKMISELKKTSWNTEAAKGNRQWIYQTCNEFGFFQTAEDKDDIFGNRFNLDFFIQQCMDVFLPNMNAKYLETVVVKTNTYYGGLKPNTTNVLYVHGVIDPWHALGLYVSNNLETPTIYIEDAAHCADMYEPLSVDSNQLINARNTIIKYLKSLLDKDLTNKFSQFT